MMKIFAIVIVIMLLMSCALINDKQYYEPPRFEIVSKYLFSINGKVFTKATAQTPFTLYNPNLYAIIITIDEIEYTINAHESLTINTP